MTDQSTSNAVIALTPPEPVAIVPVEHALSYVPVKPEQREQMNKKVENFISIVISADVMSDAFKEKVNAIHTMGNYEIKSAASLSNRMLDRPMNTLNSGGVLDENSLVGKNMLNLRKTIEALDPSNKDISSSNKLLGFIPWGNKLTDYFRQYQSSQTHLNKIIEALYNGQDELLKDNAAIEVEKVNLWDIMNKIEQYVYLGKQIDLALESRIAEIEAQSTEKARIVKEEMLFYVRQKEIRLLEQLAVSIQGYLALEMVRKTNLELIKGVDSACTTTISALRTAVMVAQALTNQKLVLDQINALNMTTSNVIAGTAKMLKQQAADISAQSSGSSLDLTKLKSAFTDIYATMDIVANYKIKALASMQMTVNVLAGEIEKSKSYIDLVRNQEIGVITVDENNGFDTVNI